MTALSSYSTGAVAVSADGTTVTGTSTLWLTAGNAKPGDLFQSGHFSAFITDVTDDTHFTITPWSGSTLSGASYAIWKVAQPGVVGLNIARDVDKLTTAFNTSGFFVFVDIAATVPDPSLGDDGQYALQPTTGKQWVKSSGVWTYQGIYKAFQLKGAWDSATAYSVGDVVTLSGSSYACVLDHTNHTPPNVTYWQLLASKGDTGTTGATGAAGANAPTYGGTSTTSLVIGTGSKVFTTQAGLAYTNGARVRASSAANTSNWMEGLATYSGTTLTMTSDKTNGSGTLADWSFNIAGAPGAGDLSSANNLSDLASASTARDNLGVPQTYGQCRLTLSGGNLVLAPFNGNRLTIAGAPQLVPDAGVSLAATSLTPGGLYYIYAYMNSGVMTLEASATAHATSTTSGNKGTEIKSGDNTRTLVGMARPVAGPAWADSDAQRFVRSWFNDGGVEQRNTVSAGTRPTVTSVSPTFAEIASAARIEALLWAGERWVLDGSGGGWLGAVGAVYFALGVNGITPEQGGGFGNSSSSGMTVTLNAASLKTGLSEGYSYATMLGAVSSNTATYISSGIDPLGCTIRGVTRRN